MAAFGIAAYGYGVMPSKDNSPTKLSIIMQRTLLLIALLFATRLSSAGEPQLSPEQENQEIFATVRAEVMLKLGEPYLNKKFCIVGTNKDEQTYAIRQAQARAVGNKEISQQPSLPSEAEAVKFLQQNFPCQPSLPLPRNEDNEKRQFLACISGYAGARYFNTKLTFEEADPVVTQMLPKILHICALPPSMDERIFEENNFFHGWLRAVTQNMLIMVSQGQRLPNETRTGSKP